MLPWIFQAVEDRRAKRRAERTAAADGGRDVLREVISSLEDGEGGGGCNIFYVSIVIIDSLFQILIFQVRESCADFVAGQAHYVPGWRVVSLEPNPLAEPGQPLYEQFLAAWTETDMKVCASLKPMIFSDCSFESSTPPP